MLERTASWRTPIAALKASDWEAISGFKISAGALCLWAFWLLFKPVLSDFKADYEARKPLVALCERCSLEALPATATVVCRGGRYFRPECPLVYRPSLRGIPFALVTISRAQAVARGYSPGFQLHSGVE